MEWPCFPETLWKGTCLSSGLVVCNCLESPTSTYPSVFTSLCTIFVVQLGFSGHDKSTWRGSMLRFQGVSSPVVQKTRRDKPPCHQTGKTGIRLIHSCTIVLEKSLVLNNKQQSSSCVKKKKRASPCAGNLPRLMSSCINSQAYMAL